MGVLDADPDPEFDALVFAASALCGVPISLISLLDADRQCFLANIGLPGLDGTPRDISFCAHAVRFDELFEVPDTAQDSRFADNPLVAGEPRIRFYAGAPISLSTGERVGILCVMDREPRRLQDPQRAGLRHLAVAAAAALESRRARRLLQGTIREAHRTAMLLQHTADAVIGLSAEGLIVLWNPAATLMFGYVEAEMIGQTFAILTPSANRQKQRDLLRAQVDGRARTYDSVGVHRSGISVALSITSVPEIDPSGRFLGTTAFLRDTSVRDRAERELAQSAIALEKANKRAALAIHSGAIGIWDWDIDGGTMLWDEQMYRLYGMAPREEFGDLGLWIHHVHPDDRATVARARTAAIESGAAFEVEFRVVWADGSMHHIRGSGQVAHDEAGRAVRMVGSNWDITERKVAAIRLEHERTQLRTLLRTIPDMVSLKDRDGVHLACNVAFERFFGACTEDIVGRLDRDFMPPALAAFFRQTDIKVLENAGTRVDESPVVSPMDGRQLILEVRKTPMRDHQGTLLGVLSLSRDITVRRQAEEELDRHRHHLQELVVERTAALEQANAVAAAAHRTSIERLNAERDVTIRSSKLEAVGTLAAGIAHDFNNILASIVAYAELAHDELPGGSAAGDSIAKIISGSFRARDLVARMLDFARARPFNPVPMDVVTQVREAIALLRPSLPPSIEIDFQNGMRGAAAMILADPTRIMQVVMNLCINAAHALENRGVIAVSLERADSIEGAPCGYTGGFCLTVADGGSGMTPEVLERIFDPFFTTKQPGEGSGLGLSVVYGIVKDLGGLMTVVSSVLPTESGTRFRVFLPAAP